MKYFIYIYLICVFPLEVMAGEYEMFTTCESLRSYLKKDCDTYLYDKTYNDTYKINDEIGFDFVEKKGFNHVVGVFKFKDLMVKKVLSLD